MFISLNELESLSESGRKLGREERREGAKYVPALTILTLPHPVIT